MTNKEYEQERESILKSNLNFDTKWVALDLLEEELCGE